VHGLARILLRAPASAAARFRQLAGDEVREQQARHRKHQERRPPRQRRDVARHQETDRDTDQFTGNDVTVDAATLAGLETVADQRRDRRRSDRHHDAQRETRRKQRFVRSRRAAPDHRQRPQRDADHQQVAPVETIDEDSERQRQQGAGRDGHRDQQPDFEIVDVQRGLELCGHRAERRLVG